MAIALKRVIKSGWAKFLRDRSSTGAALVVMVTVLFVISSLYILQGLTSGVIAQLEESVDISAYFKNEAAQEDIFQLRQVLSEMPEVKEVSYTSKEQAFEIFIERHREDPELLEPLQAIGQNPFLASLNVKAAAPEEFDDIAAFLADDSLASIIESVDFYDREPIITQVSAVSQTIHTAAFAVIAVLSFIAVLVAFNTIRLTIYNSREEIEVQRLVGASNWFIRGPFLVQGILVGVAASIVTLVIVFFASLLIGDRLEAFTGFNMAAFVGAQFFALLLLQLTVGISLGLASSTIAIRRYLRV